MLNFLKQKGKPGDRWIFIIPVVLGIFGLLMIFDASYVAATRDFNDRFYYLKAQSLWFTVGFFLMLVFSRIDLKILKKTAPIAIFVSFIFLILVLIPGVGRQIQGGRRWLDFFGFGFQPAELVKLTLVVYLASLFEKKRELLPFLFILALTLGLIVLEPDLGTAVIIAATAVSLYFFSGAPVRHFLLLFGLFSFIFPLVILTSPYRKQRLMTFLNSSVDSHGSSYHLRQVLLALGSGGFWGKGLGQSRQKYLFLPEVSTDSIFAVIAEELGFIGASFLLLTILFLVYRGTRTAYYSPDHFRQILAVGITFLFGFQALVNVSSMVSLVPMTGVPLPFISYGGSSLVIFLSSMGILYNISKDCVRVKK